MDEPTTGDYQERAENAVAALRYRKVKEGYDYQWWGDLRHYAALIVSTALDAIPAGWVKTDDGWRYLAVAEDDNGGSNVEE